MDAAQSIGQFPVDAQALGCDYIIGSGPKWLLGPMGSGYVWVAPDHTDGFRPYFTPDVGSWSMPGAPAEEPTARSRAEFGTYNHPLVIGLGTAVRTLMDVGLDVIRDHVAGLSKTLREAMLDTPGVSVLTPMEPGKSAGVTTLTFDGFSDEDLQGLVAWLDAERNILVKAQWLSAPLRLGHSGMRISVRRVQHRGRDTPPGRLPEGRFQEVAENSPPSHTVGAGLKPALPSSCRQKGLPSGRGPEPAEGVVE